MRASTKSAKNWQRRIILDLKNFLLFDQVLNGKKSENRWNAFFVNSLKL